MHTFFHSAALASIATVLLLALALMTAGVIHVTRLNRRLKDSSQALKAEVDERRQAEARLAQNDARLRQIIDTEPECVKLQNADGLLLEMNPAGLALLEANGPQEVIGTSVFNMVAPEFHTEYKALSDRVFQGESGVLEFQIVSLRRRRRWMETHAVPLRDAGGVVTALLGITRDITARKRAEDGVRLHYRELAHAARVNTMGEMASGLAHELNQPLAAIANYSRGCLHRIHSGEASVKDLAQALQQVCAQADRAAEIIAGLRQFVHKDPPHRRLEDLHEIIGQVIRIANPEIRQHEVKLDLELAPDLPRVVVHAIQMEQVILNLLRNAVEAMDEIPPEQRRLCIRTQTLEGAVLLEVQDSGPGFPSEMKFQVFEPFFTTKDAGMGMGLPISRSIVEGHGGTLTAVANERLAGLRIGFTIPLDAEEFLHEPATNRVCD